MANELNTEPDDMDYSSLKQSLREIEEKYRSLFEDAVFPIWEEDFSDVKRFFDHLKETGIVDLRAHFDQYPDDLLKCVSLVKITDVNTACVSLFEADSKAQFFHLQPSTFTDETWQVFREEIISLAAGNTEYESEMPIIDFKGNEKNVILKLKVSRESKETLSRVFISLIDITSIKRAKELIKESEMRLNRGENVSKGGNWELYFDTGIITSSSGAAKIYGIPGQKWELSVVQTIPLPEYRPILDNALKRLVDYGEPYDLEFKIKQNGTEKILDIHSIAEYDAKKRMLFGVIQDITDRKQAEEAKIVSEEKYKGLFDANKDGISIFYVNPENGQLSNFAEVNDTAALMVGYTKEEFLKLSVFDLEANPDKNSLIDMQRQIMEKNSATIETILRHKNGREIPVEIVVAPIRYNNQIALMNIVRDISERKQTEMELIAAKNKAQESDRLKSAFLTNMSHEIRTPVNAIIGFSGLLDDEFLSQKERSDYVSIIRNSGNQLVRIINDIIDISKIDSKLIVMSKIDFNLNNFLDNLFQIIQNEKIVKNKSQLEVHLFKALPDTMSTMHSDEERLRQVLFNLLENAIKFTSAGFIQFGYTIQGDMIRFFVKDTGRGISPEKQSVVFERFRQEDETYTRQFGGTGLGLTISKGLVELLDGTIWLESIEGQGTSFFFNLPFTLIEDVLAIDEPKAVQANAYDFSGKTLLIAEDVVENYELLKIYFNQTQAEILYAENGMKAIEILNHHNYIDLILMDIQMPVLNGYEATTVIRKAYPTLPIIGITAYAFPEDRQRCLDAGCNEVITKPIVKAALLDLIDSYL